jgi:succinate dehydrogenase/fumarate reductase flavoprotein subunit
MLLCSGWFLAPFLPSSETKKRHRTQSSLDEGVQKLRAIYKRFDDVGIKDWSMIWNT